jgi:hypothetical protein
MTEPPVERRGLDRRLGGHTSLPSPRLPIGCISAEVVESY